ncbi:MAG: PEP-CTERM sorting domain-containing protein, partial [Planctomycetota bacterium]
GGFASRGGASGLAVTLEGGADLNFSSADAGFNGNALQLGSPTADGLVTLTNNLNLENAEGVVQVADNPDSEQDAAEISGVVSSTAGGADVLTVTSENGGGAFDNGLLILSGANSMSKLRIEDASVAAEDGVGLPSGANLELSGNDDGRPAVWVGNGTFNRNIGTGGGEVAWVAGADGGQGGGIGAYGGDLTLSLQGGAELTWGSADSGFNGVDFQLGSNHSDGILTFTNDVTGFNDANEDTNRVMFTFGNPFSDNDDIVITGDYVEGFLDFNVDGSASHVIFEGDVTASDDFRTRADATVLFNGVVSVEGSDGDVEAQGTSNMFINGGLTLTDDMDTDGEAGFGGNGTITALNEGSLVTVDTGGFLRPGPDLDAVGTLTVNLQFGADFRIQNDATYDMEFANDGGLVNDSAMLDSDTFGSELQLGPNEGDQWLLDLSAVGDLAGLVDANDEFDLFVWNDLVDLVADGANISADLNGNGAGELTNVVLSSDDFDVSGASVNYELENFDGRLFVTGLALTGASPASAGVPEPSTWALLAIGVGLVSWRRRRSASA